MKKRIKINLIYSAIFILNLIPVIFWGNWINVCCCILILYYIFHVNFSFKKYYFGIQDYCNESINTFNIENNNKIVQDCFKYHIECSRNSKGLYEDTFPLIISFIVQVCPIKYSKYISIQEKTRPIKLRLFNNKYLFHTLSFDNNIHDLLPTWTILPISSSIAYEDIGEEKRTIIYSMAIKRVWPVQNTNFVEKDRKIHKIISNYLKSDEFRKEFDSTRKRQIRYGEIQKN